MNGLMIDEVSRCGDTACGGEGGAGEKVVEKQVKPVYRTNTL